MIFFKDLSKKIATVIYALKASKMFFDNFSI